VDVSDLGDGGSAMSTLGSVATDADARLHPHALRHGLAAAWALLVGIALLMLGTGLQGSLLGVRASIEGFGTVVTGVIMSSYYAGFLLGSVWAPRLVAGVGHIRVFAAFASVSSSTVLLHAVIVEPLGWIPLRVISGFCLAGLYVVAESWLNDASSNETRGSMLSAYMIVVSGGLGVGQLLLNVADPAGFGLFVMTSVMVSLALVPAALSVRANPRFLQPAPVTFASVFRSAPLGIVGVILTGASSGAIFTMGVVYAGLIGFSVGQISLFMVGAILAGAVVQWPIGRLSDRVDRRRVIAASALVAAIAALGGALGPENPSFVQAVIVIAVIGGFSFPMYALLNAHTNDWIDPAQMVGAGSRLVLASGIGAVTGPVLVAVAIGVLGPSGFFWFVVVANALIALYASWRLTRRPPTGSPSHFAAIAPRGTSVFVAALNPDAWDDDEPRFTTAEIPIADE